MSLTYATYTTTLANLAAYSESDADFVQILPSVIDYAEDRIYRELNLLSTVVRDTSGTVTANSRNFTLPSSLGRFIVVYQINVVTPVGSTVTTGTRNAVTPASRDVIDMLWPSETAASATTVPELFGMITDQTVIFGPPPGAAFAVEVVGTIKPDPLSASNTTTYLTLQLPDLFLAASMVFLSGYMRNYGAQAQEPGMSQSWETQYQTLKASVALQDAQQKFASASWASKAPAPLARAQ